MKRKIQFFALVLMSIMLSSYLWADTYTLGTIPSGWSTSGGNMTMNGKQWTYSSSTYIGLSSSKIQIGSKNNPQTSAWTISLPISSLGTGKKVTSIAITAYTTATTATYDISAGGSSVMSGNLTTSSATYTANSLNVTSGNIVITMTGSSNSKAMYLSGISIVYEASAGTTYTLLFSNIRHRVARLYRAYHPCYVFSWRIASTIPLNCCKSARALYTFQYVDSYQSVREKCKVHVHFLFIFPSG